MEEIVREILKMQNQEVPQQMKRCSVGHGNYVFRLNYGVDKKIIRLNDENNTYSEYSNFKYWADRLRGLDVPVPNIICIGKYKNYNYMVLDYIDGNDLGEVYNDLSVNQKMNIAKEIIEIQKKVQDSLAPNSRFGSIYRYNDESGFMTWREYILDSLQNSKQCILKNQIFDAKRVDDVIELANKFSAYFDSVEPKAFLDDVSNKNLLICEGDISGIIDLDWMGFGDLLYFVGYNYMAFLDMETDTKYVEFMMQELHLSEFQKSVVLFYTLVFCLDFMSERGQSFQDKKITANEKIVEKMNCIYDEVMEKLLKQMG